MAPRLASARPFRVLCVTVAAVACALYTSASAFSSLFAGQHHGARVVATRPALSKLRGERVFRRQESSDAPQASLVFKKGDRVQVEHEGVWYDCDILEISADGSTCTARYDDGGDEEPDIDVATRVRPMPPPMPLTKGQRVEVWYEGVWYASEVLEVGEDGTSCTAKYDDGGDEEADIDVRSRVRPPRIPLSELEVGSKHKGTVITIASFGAFVDIGAECDGLVHKSRIANERVDDVDEYLSVGQEVDVWVASVGDGKLAMSMVEGKRGGAGSPTQVDVEPFREYSRDQWITGTVQSTPPFGIFVRVPSPDGSFEATGLVHIAQIREGFVKSSADEVEVGQEVQVRVTGVADGRLALSMKEVARRGPVDLTAFESLPGDTWLKGTVMRIESYGLFVRVSTPDGSATVNGLVHITEIREGFVERAEDAAEVGQEVDVRVASVDVGAGKISFSMKFGGGAQK